MKEPWHVSPITPTGERSAATVLGCMGTYFSELKGVTTLGQGPPRLQCVVSRHVVDRVVGDNEVELRDSAELSQRKDILYVYAQSGPGMSLPRQVTQSGAAIFAEHNCGNQDWHTDLTGPPKHAMLYQPQQKVEGNAGGGSRGSARVEFFRDRAGPPRRRFGGVPHFTDARKIPCLMVLGDRPQSLNVIMGSARLGEVCTPLSQTWLSLSRPWLTTSADSPGF
jgi:hypothetical protein